MRLLPPGLQDHLDTGATTLCWCWRLTRKDGLTFGFTDHDRDLTFDGTVFEADTGLTSSELNESIGLSVDNVEVDGALSSDTLTEADLEAGLFDDARIEVFRVNWTAPEQRVLMRVGSIGEVQSGACAFRAEVRGLAHYLQQPNGRVFQYTCDAEVGDSRCGVDLNTPQFKAVATITRSLSDRSYEVTGLEAYANGWFQHGLATFLDGPNAGVSFEIKTHGPIGVAGGIAISLWMPPRSEPPFGTRVSVTAGCDKHIATCRERFSNAENFRGFPHMPGNDFVMRIAGRLP